MCMVCTIDGKIISGELTEHVLDLGSKVDHAVMDKLEMACDMVLIGANTYRANPTTWSPKARVRGVVTGSGKINFNTAYLQQGEGVVISPSTLSAPLPVVALDSWPATLAKLKVSYGVERLLLMGGSELNAQFLEQDLVDEIFLTIAPKIKLGRTTPTIAGGNPLDRQGMKSFELTEHHAVGDEMFLRYFRRNLI